MVYPGSSQADPIRSLGGITRVEIVEADIGQVLARWGGRPAEQGGPRKGTSDSDGTDQSEVVYRAAAWSVPVIRVVHTIALLHEWAGNSSGVVKYGELAEDIFDEKRYQRESEPYAVSVFEDLARASAVTGQKIFLRMFKGKAEIIERKTGARPLLSQQIENHCRFDISVIDALLLKESLDSEEEMELEERVLATVAFTNTPEYEKSSLRAFARWGLGKWRRRQRRLKEALTAFESVESLSFEVLGDWGPARLHLDYGGTCFDYYWVDQKLEYFHRAIKSFALSADLAEKNGDLETAAKSCLGLAKCYGSYDDDRSLEEARKALTRAEQHAATMSDERLRAKISVVKRMLNTE